MMKTHVSWLFTRLVAALMLQAVSLWPAMARAAAPTCGYKVVRTYPHDTGAFTEGLLYLDGFLYESTGLNGHSTLRKVELETGKVVHQYVMPARYFGEGLAAFGSDLIQLTYRTDVGFVYDRETFQQKREFRFDGEGWGLTTDGKQLIASDGSPDLRFLDPTTFQETKRVHVTDGGRFVGYVNELEYIKGEIFANVWLTDRIAVISPENGSVLRWIDVSGLKPAGSTSSDAVLNGIAYDAKGDRLFVTGKMWPSLFEIKPGCSNGGR